MSRVDSLMHTFNYRCYYCGVAVVRQPGCMMTDVSATIDHCVPRCRGGKGDDHNTVLSCAFCNNLKGDMTADEFRQFVVSATVPQSYFDWIQRRMQERLAARLAQRVKSAATARGSPSPTPSSRPPLGGQRPPTRVLGGYRIER